MDNILKTKQRQTKMKQAAIENVLVWLLTFIGFGTLFWFIMNYAIIIRIQDNMNAMSDYGANIIANEGIGADIVDRLNQIRASDVQAISAGDVVCNSVLDSPPTYQVIFTTVTTNTNYKFYTQALQTTRAVFNEVDDETVTCTLTITLDN